MYIIMAFRLDDMSVLVVRFESMIDLGHHGAVGPSFYFIRKERTTKTLKTVSLSKIDEFIETSIGHRIF